MSLPKPVLAFLDDNARSNGGNTPNVDDDLFKIGALDSFALVDFVTIIEEYCEIKIADAEVVSENFRTISQVERFVESRRFTGNAAA